MAEGKDALARSKDWGVKYYHVRMLKEKMEAELREHMGAGSGGRRHAKAAVGR